MRELDRRGHETYAPDLPVDDPTADMGEWADVVGPHPDAIVVGHSFGGFVLPLITARRHVYLCAFVPEPLRPPRDVVAVALRPDFGGAERDDIGRSYWPTPEVVRSSLYRGHESWVEWAFPKLRPQAQTVAGAPHPLAALPDTAATYILALNDPSIRVDWACSVAKSALSARAIALPGGHFPMLGQPDVLADILDRLAVEPEQDASDDGDQER